MVNPDLKSKEARKGPSSFFQKMLANDVRAACALVHSVCGVIQRSPSLGHTAPGLVAKMCKGEIIPPLCVEIVLRDGARHFLHSILAFEDETKTICARIWDLRALGAGEIEELKQRLNQIRSRKDLAPAESVHPMLDWANLHVHYDDVAYCIEWHDRIWPQSGKHHGKVAKRKRK